mmetsp:Transcript_16205/g.28298  ORF Transcript_16205/g.28298 Transcript_16205/m.28298 type:complete len:96 (-) Transcript_16205:72-359(-)
MPVSQYRPEGIQKKPVKRQWISFTANTVEMTLYDLSLRSESLEARVRVLLYPTINRLRGMEQPKERIIFPIRPTTTTKLSFAATGFQFHPRCNLR